MPLTPRSIQDKLVQIVAGLPVQPSVRILSGSCGLFSDVFMSLNAVQDCARHKLSGSIYWGRRSLYFDPARGGNAHAYWFANSEFDFSHKPVLRHLPLPYFARGDNFASTGEESPRRAAKRLIDLFAAPREEILREVDEFMANRLPPSNVLGIHVRRTDALSGFEERKSQPASNFVDEAERWLAEKPDGMVFLATDDEDTIDLFRDRIGGGRLAYLDALRSRGGVSIHGHLDEGVRGSPSRKGREALLDALILSRCDFLVRCFSFLTCYSLCVNPELRFLDLDKKNLGAVRTPWLHK